MGYYESKKYAVFESLKSWIIYGNGYIDKVRNALKQLVEVPENISDTELLNLVPSEIWNYYRVGKGDNLLLHYCKYYRDRRYYKNNNIEYPCNMIPLLVEKGNDINSQNYKGITPLIYACINGNTRIVETLLEMKCDIHIQTTCRKRTALMQACINTTNTNDKCDIIEMLLKAGSDMYLQDKRDVSAFKYGTIYISKFGNHISKIFDIFINHGYKLFLDRSISFTDLILWYKHDNSVGYKLVESLKNNIQNGFIDINIQNNKGKTIINEIVTHDFNYKCESLFYWLLQFGCDIEIKDNNGNTPLLNAIKYCHYEDRILKAGANINAQNGAGKTALIYACKYNLVCESKLLIENGCDTNIYDNDGKRAIDYLYKDNEHTKLHNPRMSEIAIMLEQCQHSKIKSAIY